MSVPILFNFDKSVNQASPCRDDYSRVVNNDSDGVEFVTFEKIDYPSFMRSRGTVDQWSLESLLKAGISPDFPISTGYATRIDGISDMSAIENVVDSILADNDSN